jgi:carboxyl-terminal processing protease
MRGAFMSHNFKICALMLAVAMGLPTAGGAACPMPGLPDALGKPTDGALTFGFGQRFQAAPNDWRLHDGVDFVAPVGTRVTAVEDGVVISIGHRGGDGRTVEIAHGKGLASSYSHLSEIVASVEGQCIKKGEVIGHVGCSGLCADPHLHFSVRRHGEAIDPASFLAERVPPSDPVADWRTVDPLALFDAAAAATAGEFFDAGLLGRIDWKALAAQQREKLQTGASPAGVVPDDVVDAVNRLLAELRTSHTRLFTPDDVEYYILQDIVRRPSMRWAGDGLQIRRLHSFFERARPLPSFGAFTKQIGDQQFIDGILEGSSADKAGLHYGDEVLAIDGAPYTPVASLRDKVGSTAKLTVRRSAGAEPVVVEVAVGSIKAGDAFTAATVQSARVIEVAGQRVGYIHIWASHDIQGLTRALEKIAANPAAPLDRVIIDMRGKVGGLSGVPQKMLEALDGLQVPSYFGQWGMIREAIWHPARDGSVATPELRGWRPPPSYPRIASMRGKAIMLIDEHARSAAEIMAYGFKRSGFGPVIGTPTAGAVTSGAIHAMPGGLLLYVGVGGMAFDDKALEGVGVHPDMRVERPLRYAAGADPVMAAALDLIAKDAANAPVRID